MGSKLFLQNCAKSACRGASFYTPMVMEVIGTLDSEMSDGMGGANTFVNIVYLSCQAELCSKVVLTVM